MEQMVLVCAGSIFGLELWRRYLVREQKIPRWASIATLVGYVIAAGGVAIAYAMLQHAFDAVAEVNPAEKATLLATSISRAMNANAVSVAAIAALAILLGVFALRPRR